jgi:hypothetical protein
MNRASPVKVEIHRENRSMDVIDLETPSSQVAKQPFPAAENSDSVSRPPAHENASQSFLNLRYRLDLAASLTDCCQLYAEYLQKTFSLEQVLVGYRSHGQKTIISAADPKDHCRRHSNETIRLALLELEDVHLPEHSPTANNAHESTACGWPASDRWNPSLLHQRDLSPTHDPQADALLRQGTRQTGSSSAAVSFPIIDADHEVQGLVLLCGELDQCERLTTRVVRQNAWISPYLTLRNSAEKPLWRRLGTAGTAFTGKKKIWIWSMVMFLALAMLPLPYQIGCDVEVRPVVRRYVSAPFDGILKNSFVKTGDLVTRGQILAVMDEDDIRLQAAAILAQQQRVLKEKGSALAQGDTLATQKARLEHQRLGYKRDLLTNRLNHLEVVSPLEGVVLHNDLQDAENASLSRGQMLLEIAPLNRMKFDIFLRQDDMQQVSIGMPVTINIEASSADFRGTIAKIKPQAILHENESVFIAEIEFDNLEGTLKPGMRGYAYVQGQSQPLGWIIFHKPIRYLKRLTGL